MNPTTPVARHTSRRLGWAAPPVLLAFAFAAACSDIDQAAPTETTSTIATSAAQPPTTVSNAATPDSSAPGSDDLGAFLDDLGVSGFEGVVAVREGADITTRAYGIADRANDVKIDAETVFDIGSITKQFTAAAILRLEMEGRLSVDDTLGDHVPGLPTDTAAITLHQLLTHTAGAPNAFGPDEQAIDRGAFLALAAKTPFATEPGERFEYSNVGYALLAAVIEFVTGEPYESYLRRELFEPAGMFDTGYLLPDWTGHTIAVGYRDPLNERFGRPNEQPWDTHGPYWNLLGNGGLLSTAADMLRWDEALIANEILDDEAKAKFFTPHVAQGDGDEIAYGYGWAIVPTPLGTPLITHNGGNGVFYAEFLRFVEQDVAVFIATNSWEDADADVAGDVAGQVFEGDLAALHEDAEPNEN